MKLSCLKKQVLAVCFLTFSLQIFANSINITVIDTDHKPIENAVVYIKESLAKTSENVTVIDQVDKEFIPYVTAIRRGSAINFPNNDEIRHQVYSFSNSKQFELPLYKGNEFRPVIFEKSGVVPLACNIHDWMKAYIYVVDTDKFVLTNSNGKGELTNLSAGQYEVLVWHPEQGADVSDSLQTVILESSPQQLKFTLAQTPKFKAWRAPKGFKRRGY
jgi:plastocyanin